MAVSLTFCVALLTIWSITNAVDLSVVKVKELPCDFLDSSNITAGTLFPNKCIVFDGIEFPEDHYAEINYIMKHGNRLFTEDPYIRGCLCKLKSCIRLCCPEGQYLGIDSNDGGICQPHDFTDELEGHILDSNGEMKHTKFDQYFGIVHSFPCKLMFIPRKQFKIKHVWIKYS